MFGTTELEFKVSLPLREYQDIEEIVLFLQKQIELCKIEKKKEKEDEKRCIYSGKDKRPKLEKLKEKIEELEDDLKWTTEELEDAKKDLEKELMKPLGDGLSTCECGVVYRNDKKASHLKTKGHKTFMSNVNKDTNAVV